MQLTTNLTRKFACFAAITIAASVLAACSAPDDASAECLDEKLPAAEQPLILAVAVHQGAPRPGLPPSVLPLVKATLIAGQPVRVVAIDGTPEPLPVSSTAISTKTCDGFRTTVTSAVNQVSMAIQHGSADSNGNNLFEAISVSADTAHGLTTSGRATIVIIDSGVPDTGPLDFTKNGMTLADPDEAAAYAAGERPLDLTGLTFELYLGYTAEPQTPLSGTERQNIVAVWVATITKLGADKVTATGASRPTEGPRTRYVTGRVPVAKFASFTPPTDHKTTSIVFGEDQIRFLPDSTELAEPQSARSALSSVAAWLASSPGHAIRITGTTASAGSEAGRLRLSKNRAATIRDLVLTSDDAIRASQIQVEGVGTHFPEFVADRRPDNRLDPLVAPANRTVRITAHVQP